MSRPGLTLARCTLEYDQAYFAKYLPQGMAWEDFDLLVEEAVGAIAVQQTMECSWRGSWVEKIDVECYLRGRGIEREAAQFCVTVCWRRLVHQGRLIRDGASVGVGCVRPAPYNSVAHGVSM